MKPLSVYVIEQNSNDNELEFLLSNQGIRTKSIGLSAIDILAIAKAKPDAVLFNTRHATNNVLQAIVDINKIYDVPIILFSDDADSKDINKVIQTGVSAYVVDGLESKRIKSIIEIAIARFSAQKSLKDELEKTKSKLEDRKLIDRAKGILIKTRNFSEDESYHTLRKLAMDRNIPIAEMAKNVISMADLFCREENEFN